MDAIELTRLAYREVHAEFLEEAATIEPDVLWWQPGGGQNHAGFLLWHAVRDEDFVIHRVVRETTELWEAEGWASRLGIETAEQGTGFDAARAAALRYDMATFLVYARRVFEATDATLGSADGSLLDREITWDSGESSMSMASQLISGSVGHLWVHLGEVRAIRGLRGWRFRE